MVLVFDDPSGWNQALSQGGSALSQALGQRLKRGMQERKEKGYGDILQESFSQLDESASPQEYQSALSNAISQGVPFDQAMKYGTLYSTLKKAEPKTMLQGKSADEISDVFQNFGMDKEVADRNAQLYSSLTTGGQTKFGEMLIDQIQRGQLGGLPGKQMSNLERAKKEMGDMEEASKILESKDMGLKPVERIRREDQRYKTNLKPYEQWQDKTKSLASESRRIDVMKQLNESGKLPKGIGLLNVDMMGNLRFPRLSSREAQKYQKLLNEFVQNARESFGARVTNFELDVFLKRLPTLWNSTEGRQSVLKQMEIVNQINDLYEKGKLEAVKKAGGIRKIDVDQAEEYATERYKNKITDLEEQYRNIENQLDNIPTQPKDTEASKTVSGKIYVNPKTGERIQLVEGKWRKI